MCTEEQPSNKNYLKIYTCTQKHFGLAKYKLDKKKDFLGEIFRIHITFHLIMDGFHKNCIKRIKYLQNCYK